MPPEAAYSLAPGDSPAAAGAPVLCTHCSLPVPAGLVEPDAAAQFCCHGCRTVYELLHQCGLEQYYRLRAGEGGTNERPAAERSYASLDDPAFLAAHARPLAGGLLTTELYVEGVHCAACVWLIERLPRVADGVIEARLDFRRALVQVTWDPQRIQLSQAAAALHALGYAAHPARDVQTRTLRRAEDRRMLIRVGVAGALAGNVMTLAFGLYGGAFHGIEAPAAALLRWTSMLLGLIALVWPGSLFFRGALAALRTRTATLDVPIALGLLVGGLAGATNTVLGRGEIYFDSLTMLVFLLLVGRWLQLRQQRWTADSLALLYSLTPSSARRVETDSAGDRTIREVPVEALTAGDLLEVRAGETIPADGTVVSGDSALDQAWLTGESAAVPIGPGQLAYAGAINVAAPLQLRVTATGAATRAGRLMQLVEHAARSRPPSVRFADRIAGWFTLTVVGIALTTFAAWWWIAPARAADQAAALLIVACPCALGLATPLAFSAAIGRAARQGILIKSGDALEALAGRGRLLLDKTGTVTFGQLRLVTWHGAEDVWPHVAALESHASHPVARALVAALRTPETAPPHVQLEAATRSGVVGRLGNDTLLVGAPAFVQERGAHLSASLADALQAVVDAALTPVLVARNGIVVAVAGLGDALRPDTRSALQALHHLGWDAALLSGDHPRVVAAVGAQLGLPAAALRGGATPEDKLAVVQETRGAQPVVMIGDGVNDAAALSAATVGIAVHGGAEASLAAADVYLAHPGLTPIVALIEAARRTLHSIRWCFAASLAYNLIAIALAATGIITPIIAAILMPLSSLTVVGLVLGRSTFGRPACP